MVIRADIFSGNVTQDEDEGIKGDTEDDDPAFPHPGIHKRHGSRRHGNLLHSIAPVPLGFRCLIPKDLKLPASTADATS